MSARRRHVGRVKVAFAEVEAVAAKVLAESALAAALGGRFTLTKHSALHRRRDGSYTLCLVWHGDDGTTLTHTIRGLALEAA